MGELQRGERHYIVVIGTKPTEFQCHTKWYQWLQQRAWGVKTCGFHFQL